MYNTYKMLQKILSGFHFYGLVLEILKGSQIPGKIWEF